MSGDNYYFGDSVTMHGGMGNTGIVKRQAPAADTASLVEAVADLRSLIESLRDQVPAASAQAIDDSLPAIRADAGAVPQDRHRALMAVAGIAATIGAVGQPVLEAVNRVLGLVGGQ
ncbi:MULTISPECIES: hypothetical protein [unclassified Streptomyces]|uniref:hypothetical protein n=1 Tax=unclassified Streptomyces TaxID=2593676 RepID=UPI0022542BFA|nr:MULTISPECIES: hypothetical protein [unclassified Streptomyces]MCX5332297.1 hypothetical protein [Streptomyces sp. NBC_00140]MCX5361674.1 hypothetical protein [Streptomyces sp. NBC_00124]